MKEQLKKAWTWVKGHKEEILVTCGSLLIGSLAVYGACELFDKHVVHKRTFILDLDKLPKMDTEELHPKLGLGEFQWCDKHGDDIITLAVDKLSISDIGELGKEISSNIPDITENASIWTLVSIKEG